MAASVTAYHQQRAQMEKQVIEAGERERRRLGHELHDGLGQRLTAAALAADALTESLSASGCQEATRTTEMARQIRDAIKETRLLSHGLAPLGIEHGGLVNALKHASPGEIRIGLRHQANRLLLEVEDDGPGMPETMPPGTGMGLQIMRHRAQLLGGSLSLSDSPAGGTLMRCELPCES